MYIDMKPYWLKPKGVKQVERAYDAKFIGHWCARLADGTWSQQPLDVFYVEEPDFEAGHSNYFGITVRGNDTLITNAASCFEEPIIGFLSKGKEVVVSRYRHDYQERSDGTVDGGRDYLKMQVGCILIGVEVKDGEFTFNQVDK